MASSLFWSSAPSLVSSTVIRRRLPLIGVGFSNLCPLIPSPFNLKTGRAQSLSFVAHLSTQLTDKTVHAVKMEANSDTVPSIVAYVTVPNREAGIESVYQWEGKINSDPEELLIIKTRQSLLEALTEHVKANHEYDVPEVIALPITGGSPQYLNWLKNSTRD